MARRVFFSFHYERDISRANVVRNCWVCHQDREAAGFFDASLWEETKRKGDDAIKRMIDRGLDNTSVTVVLIGAETADRTYVKYEIQESARRNNALLGVYIHNIRDFSRSTDFGGRNPFQDFRYTDGAHQNKLLSEVHKVYDWISHDGFNNIGAWIESAARQAGR